LEQQFSDDGCAFVGLSGGQTSENPIDPPEPAALWAEPLEDGASYLIELTDFYGCGRSACVPMLYHSGYWISPDGGDAAYVDGPLTVREAGYRVVGKVASSAR
jgi:hypothetical protein